MLGWQIRKCSFFTKGEGGGSCGRAVTLLRHYSSVTGGEDSFISALPLFPSRDCDCYLHFPVISFVFSLYMGCFTYARYISVLFVMP